MSAARGFRSHGYEGLGVDRLAKEAGLTSGAFYAHYKSKAAAFREVVVAGMEDLRAGIDRMRRTHGGDWRKSFVYFYLSERRTCKSGDACALQSLTDEVARADDEIRDVYEAELRKIIDITAAGMRFETAEGRKKEATALLALLAGGVSLARAVRDPAMSENIASSVRWATTRLEQNVETSTKKHE